MVVRRQVEAILAETDLDVTVANVLGKRDGDRIGVPVHPGHHAAVLPDGMEL